MMYIIRFEIFIEIDSLQHFKISRQTYPTNYKPAKNLRYNIHCFDVMLIFQNNAHYTYLHD